MKRRHNENLTDDICKVGSHQLHSLLCNEHTLTALILLELPVTACLMIGNTLYQIFSRLLPDFIKFLKSEVL